MLALVSAALAGEADAAAGRAEFIIGSVTIAGRDGVQRPLARGTELDNGDTVRTNDGRAQIRFIDGAYVSLQPNTEYSIRDYRYEARTDGSERGFFGLLKGAMRTVTGAIGRVNRDRYQITTPTATVGIRGTGGVIQVQDDGSTLVIGTSGIWSLTNPAGSVDVPAGTSALAPTDPNQPPQETTQQPTSGPAPLPEEQPEFVQGEQVDEAGLPIIPQPTVLVSGSGFFLVSAFNSGLLEGINVIGNSASAVFDAAGQMTAATGTSIESTLQSGGSHADFGTDGILAWGRWIGPVQNCFSGGGTCSNDNYLPNEGFHYVIGMPTPVLPTSGGGTYTLAGATRPTYQFDQGVAPGTFSGTLNVVFGALAEVTANFNIAMPDGKGFTMVGNNLTITSPDWQITPTVTGSGGACSSGCTGFISGFFAGLNAERAGVGYHIGQNFVGPEVIGAAAFKAP
ncbi:MAG: FecR family protein [Betaproteobacteria bacterium]